MYPRRTGSKKLFPFAKTLMLKTMYLNGTISAQNPQKSSHTLYHLWLNYSSCYHASSAVSSCYIVLLREWGPRKGWWCLVLIQSDQSTWIHGRMWEADVYTQNKNEDTVKMQPQITNDELRLKFTCKIRGLNDPKNRRFHSVILPYKRCSRATHILNTLI